MTTEHKFFELIEVISQEQLLSYLDWGTTAMWEQIGLKGDPFMWINGVHYFQPIPKGKVTFNKRMIEVWLTAKCQKDPDLHMTAIQRFQELHPGAVPTRGRRKNLA
ncbi:MAG: hypothetical protein J0L70_26630 [Leptolyngbya sp. UWPOB_LEPTO1]|uniref:hypothetical protein n=1 Tax=Leptolyngbya sp. UWPOB_LEPTO1 TaxID=2815653 RepID=UPI001ACA56A6|nr:hypothetical protein [Leptolyngbya sp. UWPOB_LEPTO1]MBN8564117.1 hypothetical protein [Leptolyngbya sp. UWPOB_LEPTO1]